MYFSTYFHDKKKKKNTQTTHLSCFSYNLEEICKKKNSCQKKPAYVQKKSLIHTFAYFPIAEKSKSRIT